MERLKGQHESCGKPAQRSSLRARNSNSTRHECLPCSHLQDFGFLLGGVWLGAALGKFTIPPNITEGSATRRWTIPPHSV